MLLNSHWQIANNDNCSEIQEWVEEESKMGDGFKTRATLSLQMYRMYVSQWSLEALLKYTVSSKNVLDKIWQFEIRNQCNLFTTLAYFFS